MAVGAFREEFLSGDSVDPSEFSSWEARRLRYDILWSFFENTAYRDIHGWARKLRADLGLYRYTRHIYNPAYRLANFWQTYLMGGPLDRAAGDGAEIPSALPIITDSDPLRRAIAALWEASNWQVSKDIWTLRSTVLGDGALQIVDDTQRGRVYLQVVHPAIIKDLTLDERGNVRGYEFEYARDDPLDKDASVTYLETAERDGENVVYRTFRNGQPFAWNGEQSEWEEPYGFVPLVVNQHNNVGLPWGWSELHPALSKVREADDLASKTSDYIRKAVETPWLFVGAKPPTSLSKDQTVATATRPEPGREELPVLYIQDPSGTAKAQSLTAELDLEGSLRHLEGVLAEIENEYPELKFEVLRVGGQTSGEALRVAQEPVETKATGRRVVYDDALRRAQMMAVAIGGLRGYEGYKGFGLESYRAGALDHSIGARPVFNEAPIDRWARESKFWEAVKNATGSGAPLDWVLLRMGLSTEDVEQMKRSPLWQAVMGPAGEEL